MAKERRQQSAARRHPEKVLTSKFNTEKHDEQSKTLHDKAEGVFFRHFELDISFFMQKLLSMRKDALTKLFV